MGYVSRVRTVSGNCSRCRLVFAYEKHQGPYRTVCDTCRSTGNTPYYTPRIRKQIGRDPEKRRASHRGWRAKNGAKIADWNRRPQAQEAHRIRTSVRRHSDPVYAAQYAKRAGRWTRITTSADGSVDEALCLALYRETHCAYCCEPTRRRLRQLDHVMPISAGGIHSEDNLVMSCRRCNLEKRAKLPLQWLIYKNGGSFPVMSNAGALNRVL